MIKKKKNCETVVYCGPTIPGVVRRFTSFVDGTISSELREYADKCSAFNELIVSANNLSETNRQLRDPHSKMSVFYKKAENFIKSGGEN